LQACWSSTRLSPGSGRSRPGYPRCLKSRLALNASVSPRRSLEDSARCELGPWRRGEALARWRSCRRCAPRRWICSAHQSMLTGESLPIEAGAGVDTYAGALVRRGEATAEVTATGVHTKFGVRQNLSAQPMLSVRSRKPCCGSCGFLPSSMAESFFSSGRMLFHAMPWSEIIPLAADFGSCVSSRGIPATFTLAAALGLALSPSWAYFLLDSPLSTKRQPSMSCARTRRNPDLQPAFSHQRPSHARLR